MLICLDTGLRISDVLNLNAGIKRSFCVIEQKTKKQRKVKLSKKTHKQLKKTSLKLGFAHVSSHSLRKSYAIAFNKEHGLKATQRELRHDSAYTTMHYLKKKPYK